MHITLPRTFSTKIILQHLRQWHYIYKITGLPAYSDTILWVKINYNYSNCKFVSSLALCPNPNTFWGKWSIKNWIPVLTVSTGSSALRRTFCTFLEVEEKKIAVSLLAGFATSKKNCDLRGPPLKYKSSPTMRLPLRCGHSPQMVMVPTAIIKRAMDARARAPADDIVQFTRTHLRFRPICKDADSNRRDDWWVIQST